MNGQLIINISEFLKTQGCILLEGSSSKDNEILYFSDGETGMKLEITLAPSYDAKLDY